MNNVNATTFPFRWERFRTLTWDGRGMAAAWFAVHADAGRIYCYREYVEDDASPARFARAVVSMTPEAEEIRTTWTHPAVWDGNGLGKVLRASGLYTRAKDGTDEGCWIVLRDYLEPMELMAPDGTFERATRLQVLTECERCAKALQTLEIQRDKATGDLLVARALLLACITRPPNFAILRDPLALREAQKMKRLRQEFPQAFETPGKKRRY